MTVQELKDYILSEIERRKKSLRAGICNDQAFTRKQKNEMLVASEELSRFGRFLDTLSEEPDKSLEEAARMYAIPHYMKDVDVNYLEEYPYDKIAEAAFIAGAEWQKEQMKKETVEGEGEVQFFGETQGVPRTIKIPRMQELLKPFKDGDKVRIIIVKEDAG